MKEVFQTAVFALRPTATKRAVIDRALDGYGRALQQIVGAATADAALLADIIAPEPADRGRQRAPSAREIVTRLRMRYAAVGAELSSALRDSLLQVAATQLASYAGLRGSGVPAGVPRVNTVGNLTQEREAAMVMLAGATTLADERRAAARVERAFRAGPRAFCLLQRARELDLQEGANGRFHVNLPLLARGAERSRVILGLFGDQWQEEEFLRHPDARPRYAVLSRRDEKYVLHVTFAFNVPASAPVRSFLAVYPGICGAIGACLVALDGTELRSWEVKQNGRSALLLERASALRESQERGSSRRAARGRAVLRELAARAAHEILDTAGEYGARLMLPDLTGARNRVASRFAGERIQLWNYRQVLRMLAYKSARRGQPEPIMVRAGIAAARECPECGHGAGARFSRAEWQSWSGAQARGEFACAACGYTAPAALAAARTLARARSARTAA